MEKLLRKEKNKVENFHRLYEEKVKESLSKEQREGTLKEDSCRLCQQNIQNAMFYPCQHLSLYCFSCLKRNQIFRITCTKCSQNQLILQVIKLKFKED